MVHVGVVQQEAVVSGYDELVDDLSELLYFGDQCRRAVIVLCHEIILEVGRVNHMKNHKRSRAECGSTNLTLGKSQA